MACLCVSGLRGLGWEEGKGGSWKRRRSNRPNLPHVAEGRCWRDGKSLFFVALPCMACCVRGFSSCFVLFSIVAVTCVCGVHAVRIYVQFHKRVIEGRLVLDSRSFFIFTRLLLSRAFLFFSRFCCFVLAPVPGRERQAGTESGCQPPAQCIRDEIDLATGRREFLGAFSFYADDACRRRMGERGWGSAREEKTDGVCEGERQRQGETGRGAAHHSRMRK